jgi:RNA polymerase sigma-70 factor (ECF subfamily)
MHIQTGPGRQHTAISDGILVQQALAGNEDAFAVLVHRYSSCLFSYARKFFKDDDQVSDIIQKVFIRLYTALPTLHTDLSLKSWLYQVTHNCCIDELRVNRNHVFHFSELEEVYDENELPIIEAIPDSDPLPEVWAEYRELQHYLHHAIQTLPVRARTVVLLRYEGHFTFPEIGQILHLPTATVKTYFQRAKPRLRKALLAVLPQSDCL